MAKAKFYIKNYLIENTVSSFSKNFLIDTKIKYRALTIFFISAFITGIGSLFLGLTQLLLWLALWIVNVGAFVFSKIFYRSKSTVTISVFAIDSDQDNKK